MIYKQFAYFWRDIITSREELFSLETTDCISLCLLSKLKHYSIYDKIGTWVSNFLKQRVVVDRIQSDLVTVDLGVPQGTVLCPILFLLHINDLPSVISSKVRLFADDCLVYREIKSKQDQNDLQKDLNLLESWGTKWGMRFNAAKCNIMRVSRKQKPYPLPI